MKDFLFYKGLDSYGNDIKLLNLQKLKNEELKVLYKCKAFNTHGWVKNKIADLQTSPHFNFEKDGIYIKNLVEKTPIYVVNLERRPDRWEKIKTQLIKEEINNFHKFKAVDGSSLEITKENIDILKIFKDNDFKYTQGNIGCALSHLNLWKQLIQDKDNYYYIVMEDDIDLIDDFKLKLNLTLHYLYDNPKIDIHFMGHNLWWKFTTKNTEFPKFQEMEIKKYNGGAFGYIITKAAAAKFIHISETHGVKRAIDKFMEDNMIHMTPSHSEPHIVYTQYVTPTNNVDSDIQRNPEMIKFNL
jgi:GR25 family glycosyltransferase involved in LPS biosynthesis